MTEKVQLILQLLHPYTFIPTSMVIREMGVFTLFLTQNFMNIVGRTYLYFQICSLAISLQWLFKWGNNFWYSHIWAPMAHMFTLCVWVDFRASLWFKLIKSIILFHHFTNMIDLKHFFYINKLFYGILGHDFVSSGSGGEWLWKNPRFIQS